MPQHPDAEEAWRRHRLELENAVLVAAGELAKIVRTNPNASLDEIAAIYHGVSNKFRPIAAASAFRALENSRRAYDQWDLPDPVAADSLSFQQARATTGWALWNATEQRYDHAGQHLPELVGSLGRAVRGGSRDTIYKSARRAKTLYARVPGVKACWFCLMLASRKAEYTSREAAGIVQNSKSKRFGMAFHDHCSCMVIESYSDADLPNILHDLDQEWQATVGIADHPEVEPLWQRRLWRQHVAETRPNAYSIRETQLRGPARERTAANDEYWSHRQRRLGIDDSGVKMKPHEIELVEALKSLGDPPTKWLPAAPQLPDGRLQASNDMMWHGQEFEVKRTTSATYPGIKGSITQYVKKARETGVVKERFLIDLGDRAILSEKVRHQAEKYNLRHPDATIEELWIFDRNGLHKINLRNK